MPRGENVVLRGREGEVGRCGWAGGGEEGDGERGVLGRARGVGVLLSGRGEVDARGAGEGV